MKSPRRNHDEGLLREITNPLQNSKSMEAGALSIVGKAITKKPSKQSKNCPVTKNSSKQSKNSHHGIWKSGRENIPPSDLSVPSAAVVLPSSTETIQECHPRNESAISAASDVQVAVRIRPLNAHEESSGQAVKKVSSDSLCIGDKTFRFDSVFDSNATQEDVFHQVGAPLLKNCLVGFNTTLLLYGQTGSGKTYTIWGPQSAIICDSVANNLHRGIAPRFFEMLFSEIQKEKENCGDKQLSYQCRCSFLEVYNEQIADLLDPTKRNLQLKEDVKNGVYVENLTEECVMNMDDVNNLLIKGLSNRRVGASSMNSKSSRSHIVLTCLIESWCKETSSTCFSSSKCSRASFIDIAGSEKQKFADAGHQLMKEYKNVKQSLSYLGNVVKIVADGSRSGNARHIPYRCSPLTYLLQDSIGGNTKLTVLCTVSPAQRYSSDTSSTLRFGQQCRAIGNKATVNEITENDVSNLGDQIRQLKEELIRVKSSTNSSGDNGCKHLKAWNTRESLNKLRFSLNHSIMLSQIDAIQDEEETPEEDLAEFCNHLHKLCSSSEENLFDMDCSSDQSGNRLSPSRDSCIDGMKLKSMDSDTDLRNLEVQPPCPAQSCTDQITKDCINEPNDYIREPNDCSNKDSSYTIEGSVEITQEAFDICGSSTRLQVNPCNPSCVLQEPTESTSPRIIEQKKKGLTGQSLLSHDYCSIEAASPTPTVPKVHESHSMQENCRISASLLSSKKLLLSTENLAASLQRGMQIFGNNRQDSITRKSSSFSFVDLGQKPFEETNRVNAEVQTSSNSTLTRTPILFMSMACKKVNKILEPQKCVVLDNKSSSMLDTINSCELEASESEVIGFLANDSHKENLLADASSDQSVLNEKLNRLVQQYEQDSAENLRLINSQRNEILRLEGLLNANLISNEGSETRRCHSLEEYECQTLNDNHDNHRLVKRANSNVEKMKLELDTKYRASFGLTEKEALLQEIEDLRNQLQSYMEGGEISQKETPSLLESARLRKSICVEPMTDESVSTKDEAFELERQRWMETESQWILLTEGLRVDLERSRSLEERKEIELNLEKKCSDELSDALQRAIQGHAKIIEQYADLQDNYTTLLSRHRKIMEGIEEVKRAASKAGKRGAGSVLAESLPAELSALRFEKDRERDHLRKENRRLKIQLKDTAEAVQAAGELLVRLKEAEAAATNAEERCKNFKQEVEHMKHKIEKLEKKHVKELDLLKAHLASSRLPESALEPLLQQHAESSSILHGRHQDWGQDFAPDYHERDGIFSSTSNQMHFQSNGRNTIWEKWNESAA